MTKAPPIPRKKRSLSMFVSVPYIVWMLLFILVPLGMVVWFGFTTSDGAFTLDNFAGVMKYGKVFFKPLYLSLIATVVCLLIGFPVGYLMSRMSEVGQRTLLMLVMLPMWMSFLLRT